MSTITSTPSGNLAEMTEGDTTAMSDVMRPDAPDEQLVTLPFFLGRRTARQFRRLFGSVLLLSLPLAVGSVGYQYTMQKLATQKLIAVSTISSDMRFVAKAADLFAHGDASAKDAMQQTARALGMALTRLQPHPILSQIMRVPEEQATHMGAISRLIADLQDDVLVIQNTEEEPTDTEVLRQSLQKDTAAYVENLYGIARLGMAGTHTAADAAEWEAVGAMASLGTRWLDGLRLRNQVNHVALQMPDALAAFAQHERALLQAVSGLKLQPAPGSTAAGQVATLMQSGRALSDTARKLRAATEALEKRRKWHTAWMPRPSTWTRSCALFLQHGTATAPTAARCSSWHCCRADLCSCL